MTTMNPISMQSTGGCWQSFITGAKIVGSYCLEGMKKAAIWAAAFFSALAAKAAIFVKLHAVECTFMGLGLTVGIAIALIFSRCFGCCNKPVATQGS